jgi:hypothetical protein
MTEVLLVLLIFVVAAGGLGLGLLSGRGPVKTSCSAAACLERGACEVCPRRNAAREGGKS